MSFDATLLAAYAVTRTAAGCPDELQCSAGGRQDGPRLPPLPGRVAASTRTSHPKK